MIWSPSWPLRQSLPRSVPQRRRDPNVHSRRPGFALFAVLLCAAFAPQALAYIGPGAGVAFVSSFGVLLVTLLVASLAILVWPLRKGYRALTRKKRDKAVIKRFIVVGLDGQDPRLTDRFMSEGKLPNFTKLAEQGGYTRLETTYPSISPVAWSSFATGTQPGKHNIFDFLDRDPRTYLPLLSSTRIGEVSRFLKLGKWRIPLESPELRLMRKSRPFWSILGDYYIWSSVLRVPITFPPDEFYGAELSAMCVPDLLGTQGTFLLFTTRPADAKFKEGGARFDLEAKGNGRYEGIIEGPPNTFRVDDSPLALPLVLEIGGAGAKAKVTVGEETVELEKGVLSPWVKLVFPAVPMLDVNGICRMELTEVGEHVSLYITPIALDPENPVMPISHPSYYSNYLAKKIGPFSTLGLAEDTWALNEKVVEDGTFLRQSYDIDKEREEMFFAALDRLSTGSLSCVFDGTDRIQHMFWRYMEEGHPAAAGVESPEHGDAIEKLYQHNDALVGRVMEKIRPGDVLLVISDHGFTSFRRGINLNAWLLQEGYLVLKEGTDGSTEWLRDVDWSKTRAYALGLTGMYLNLKGREAEGIVEPGDEARALKAEIIQKMSGLRDEEKGEVAINELFNTAKIYEGPYQRNAPDFIVGYNHGYRVSWDCASGMISGPIFEDNTKAWSGDHGVDPRLVPGVIFSNHPLDDDQPAIIDIAPTVLQLFGITPPAHMDGKPIFRRERFGGTTPGTAAEPLAEPEQEAAGG